MVVAFPYFFAKTLGDSALAPAACSVRGALKQARGGAGALAVVKYKAGGLVGAGCKAGGLIIVASPRRAVGSAL